GLCAHCLPFIPESSPAEVAAKSPRSRALTLSETKSSVTTRPFTEPEIRFSARYSHVIPHDTLCAPGQGRPYEGTGHRRSKSLVIQFTRRWWVSIITEVLSDISSRGPG